MRRALKFGFRLPWLTPRGRPRRRHSAYPLGKADRAFAAEELERWTKSGFIRRVVEAEQGKAPCLSPAFVCWARPTKPRLVVDLRQVNEHLLDIPFKYEALSEFMAALHPLDHLISWDIKDAYHHVYIHPDDRPYLTFTINGAVYEPITMPFGLSLAPWAWTKVMRPVLAYLRRTGFTLMGYVDDHGAAAPGRRPVSKSDAAKGFRAVTLLYEKLGLSLHPEKGERDGAQVMDLLGFTLDTASNAVRLTEGRLCKLRGQAMGLVTAASKNRRWVRRKHLERLAGMVASSNLAVPEARLFARSFYDDLRRSIGSTDCRLTHQSIRDLRYWANFGRAGHGRPIWPQAPSHTLHTDASGAGWGGVLDNKSPARGVFASDEAGWHINVKEVAAIRFSLMSHAPAFAPGSVIKIITDSQVALHVVNALVSRSAPLCAEVRRLHVVAQKLGVTLDAEWIPTAANVWADKLSRTKDSTTWTLDPSYFASLDSVYGPHHVDRFATWRTKQLPRYNSEVLEQGGAPTGPFQLDWADDNNWANPPFAKIPLVLDLIKTQGATATVVVPVWTAQPWWQPALAGASEILYLPRQAGVFFQGADGARRPRPHWRVAALRFTRGWRDPPRPPGHAPQLPSARTLSGPGPAPTPPRIC